MVAFCLGAFFDFGLELEQVIGIEVVIFGAGQIVAGEAADRSGRTLTEADGHASNLPVALVAIYRVAAARVLTLRGAAVSVPYDAP